MIDDESSPSHANLFGSSVSEPGEAVYECLTQGFREASRILKQTNSTLAVDRLLSDLAAYVEGRQDSKGVKDSLVCALESRGGLVSGEVIQYFAHRFRWGWLEGEVRSRYLRSLESGDRRTARYCERILEAFLEDWEDRDLFPSLVGS